MQRDALAWEAFRNGIYQIPGESEFDGAVTFRGQCTAHKAALVGWPAEYNFRQYRLIKLHHCGTRGEQARDLLSQDAHDIECEVFPVGVSAIRNAFHPHGAGQQIRTRQRDFYGTVGQCAGKFDLVDRDAAAAP